MMVNISRIAYISLENAKLAKELGFNWGCPHHCYIENNGTGDISNKSYIQYAAPTQEVLKKWLRETKDLHIDVENNNNPLKGKWIYEIARLSGGMLVNWHPEDSIQYDTYEEAFEAGLTYCLNHLKEKK